jgi:hypothetical protein
MSKPELTAADFYDGLSDEDRALCARDVQFYGNAFATIGADGVKRRRDPNDFALINHETGEVRRGDSGTGPRWWSAPKTEPPQE